MSFSDDLPKKSEIFDHWKNRLLDLRLVIDWGEPGCWACGFHYGSKYDIKKPDADWDQIFRCWDQIPLQRCHIVPRSLGGSDDVENLFLLCRECHDTAPNTIIPKLFINWAVKQNYINREQRKILNAFEAFGVSEQTQTVLLTIINSKDFDAWSVGKVGLHRPQSNYAPVSSRLTPATLVGLALHYLGQKN